ncbi:5'-adenylylsulfate reductase-like 4 [Linum perenne]
MGSRLRVLKIWLGIVVLASALSLSATAVSVPTSSRVSTCPTPSITESILGFRDSNSDFADSNSLASACVDEGDEVSLQRAMDLVFKGRLEYVAVFFYAAWCPFSKAFKPKFPLLASLYPSIPHIAVEESAIRPSMLSKYGVHGFPTLLLLNSTMRVRYHGSRTLSSLVTFYNDVAGHTITLPDKALLSKVWHPSSHGKLDSSSRESCPFSWPRSPEKLLRQETYLALASAFVLSRLLYLIFPGLIAFSRLVWRRQIHYPRIGNILDHPRAFLKDVVHAFKCLVDPCKKSNLQEGAMNARAWASKSLATVSIGEASSSRAAPIRE